MPNPKIEMVSPNDLKPYDGNARTHPPSQMHQILASIQAFGFRNPILIDAEDGVIAGHGRLDAAIELGMSKVPCLRLNDLTEEQVRAYRLADNRIALNAGWDEKILKLELADLSELNVDLEGLGFNEAELNHLLSDAGAHEGEDDCPEIHDETVTVRNDVWLLGRHRLMCGDSTSADDVERLLDVVEPHLMVTDPPYGVNYDPTWRDEALKGEWSKAKRSTGVVEADDRADWREAWGLFPGDVAYVWHDALQATTVDQSLAAAGLITRSQIIWRKQHFVIGRGHYHWQHEPCFYAVRKGKQSSWQGDRSQSTIWDIENAGAFGGDVDDGKTDHGTQKPVECMRRPILNNSSPGQAVYEPFSGSGTTIVAAETTGRACYAMEISPSYVDMAVRRWQDFTGEQAVRQDDGTAFDDCPLRAS